ncbi:DUF3613 domain-containing protein [Pokkaliibacter sp. CJK22405]|uniref:DUF3613 domain-containing protein n=1 Tax=Pokkaliibacter sp. CJK22405 TaxID=3384615 RepID=UPI003984D01C
MKQSEVTQRQRYARGITGALALSLLGLFSTASVAAGNDASAMNSTRERTPMTAQLDNGQAMGQTPSSTVQPMGSQTRYWLQLQRQGSMASDYQDQLTPEAATQAKKRMEDSFALPIPDTYIEKTFGSD